MKTAVPASVVDTAPRPAPCWRSGARAFCQATAIRDKLPRTVVGRSPGCDKNFGEPFKQTVHQYSHSEQIRTCTSLHRSQVAPEMRWADRAK
jgi:hypothetical protein